MKKKSSITPWFHPNE